ncbi:hypothetical protein [Streptomyces sp. MMG1121]|uniref:hypothetical protein n=1 Tax=Streptomyces sp. MMG1121 TaxID=1415544 RepID=UPI0006C6C4F1|nr:hypothetical protein [Streptomyces sp. MMG1121]KOV65522.1 hypothetical protein ADK64_14755 [Streptomyces sp. MMG1121]
MTEDADGEDIGTRPRWLAAALPGAAAAALYAWAHWCLVSASAPSTGVAVVAGAVLVGCACAVYFALVSGSGGLFGALFLAIGPLMVAATADQLVQRTASATCVVRAVHDRKIAAFGEDGIAKTVYRLALDCPGGYPTEINSDRRIASEGRRVHVAYDPRHRVAPIAGEPNTPWKPGVGAVVLLLAATAFAARRRVPAGPSQFS